MLFNKLFFTLLTIITAKSSHALPTERNLIAYNLHQDLSPRDVNELTRDQKVKAALDVQATIDEVQKLLALDPTLPRLTKGEIKDLFEKATKDELEKSILSGDQAKQEHMKYLIQALPFHSDEIDTLEQLAKKAATTRAPSSQPKIPDDLKKLLGNYGLLDGKGEPIEIAPLPLSSLIIYEEEKEDKSLTPEETKKSTFVNAKDYEAFKPIEANKKNISSDMETYLKQFGLAGDEPKKRKSNRKNATNSSAVSIDSSYLTPNFSSLLGNIGIATTKDKRGKKINTKTSSTSHRPSSKSAEEYQKLEHLLETIKELEKLNTSLTEKEVDRLNLRNFNFSESLLAGGPDPINYQAKFSALKNEVKRQNPTEPTRVSLALTGPLLESSLEATDDSAVETSSTKPETKATTEKTTTTTEEATTSESSSSTEEAKKNSLEDEIEPIEDPEPLPPPRRSGFYMLFDWNSFLEVGEDPSKTVIRFDPKIGDPSRFFSVNVP